MKRLIGIGIAALALALPAGAQTMHASGGGMASPLTATGGGGGGSGYGSGGGSGDTSVNKLPSYPRACLAMAAVSGTRAEYVPSTFVAYDKAVADGETVDDTPAPTVADAARAQRAALATTEKSKFKVVQNYYGYPIAIPR